MKSPRFSESMKGRKWVMSGSVFNMCSGISISGWVWPSVRHTLSELLKYEIFGLYKSFRNYILWCLQRCADWSPKRIWCQNIFRLVRMAVEGISMSSPWRGRFDLFKQDFSIIFVFLIFLKKFFLLKIDLIWNVYICLTERISRLFKTFDNV